MSADSARGSRRNERYKGDISRDKISPNRYRWTVAGHWETIIYDGVDTEGAEDKGYPDWAEKLDGNLRPIRLMIRRGSGRTIITLTWFTVEELEAMKATFMEAFDLAIERSALLDAAAQKQFDEGDDSAIRLFRPPPTTRIRKHVLTRPMERGENGDDDNQPDRDREVPGDPDLNGGES